MRLLYLVLVVKMLRLMLDEDMLSLALCCASLFERFTEDPCDLEGVQQHSTKCEKSDTQVRCKVLAIYRHRNHPVHASASGASVQGLSRRQISRATHASGASARLRFRTTSGTCSWSQAELSDRPLVLGLSVAAARPCPRLHCDANARKERTMSFCP